MGQDYRAGTSAPSSSKDDDDQRVHSYLGAMLSRLGARVEALGPFRLDLALALFGCVAVVAEALLLDSEGHSRALTALLGVALTLPAAWRRRDLLPVAAGFAVVVAAATLLDSFLITTLTTPFIVSLVLLYTAGRHEDGRRTWLAAALVAVPLWLTVTNEGPDGAVNAAVFGVILFVSPVVAGRAMRRRAVMQRELRERTERLEAQRDQRALEAAEDERNRIAAELQAVVANGVSAMVVQAEGVSRALESGSSQRAAKALQAIEESGRETLAEMRRLLGVLRRDDDHLSLRPQPSLAEAEALVARSSDGIPIKLRVEGTPTALPPGIDLAAYRVLAKAIDSARAAGGVSGVEVEIRYGDREVRLSVEDDRAGSAPDGTTVAALRERVALYDGRLDVEPGGGGRGVRLTARLPCEAVAT
jgi:signal transduction histidine kinase